MTPAAPWMEGDRRWFATHPNAVVRLRRERQGEFAALETVGAVVPSFRPAHVGRDAPLLWVAVVDVMRLQGHQGLNGAGSMRLRLRTAAVHSTTETTALINALCEAISQELDQLEHGPRPAKQGGANQLAA